MNTTVLQNQELKRESNIDYIWDGYKVVHGHKPRFDFSTMTNVEIQDMATSLKAEIKETIRQEKIREKEANENFEKSIALCLSSGAKTRKQAIRWLFASLDEPHLLSYFIEDLCYLFGISCEAYYLEFKTIFPKARIRGRYYFKY
tara:strand:+ start:100 stop:534 length:435 start_codon:yes stop_codon:yes gene_type:complete